MPARTRSGRVQLCPGGITVTALILRHFSSIYINITFYCKRMVKKKDWTHELITTLINMYRERSCLWKLTDVNYMNKTVKQKAYEAILEEVNKTVPDMDMSMIKAKIQNLRTSFRKEQKKMEALLRSGKTEEIYEPTLWYFDLLSFVTDQDASIPSVNNHIVKTESSSDIVSQMGSEYSDDDGDNWLGYEGKKDVITPEVSTEQQSTCFKPVHPGRKRKSVSQVLDKNMTDFVPLSARSSLVQDECSIFGTYISLKLNKMDASQQILAEALIQQVITKGLKRRLTENTAVVESDIPF